ncbi:UNVERIFIED_CONTAM: hypothetical protein B566_EDAN017960 [Ephemera danica]|nr:hypothetical protein B566_EDAN017960 [Ephemera danica]
MPRWHPPRCRKPRYQKLRRDIGKNVNVINPTDPVDKSSDDVNEDDNENSSVVTQHDSIELSARCSTPVHLFKPTSSSTPGPSYVKCSPQPVFNQAGTKTTYMRNNKMTVVSASEINGESDEEELPPLIIEPSGGRMKYFGESHKSGFSSIFVYKCTQCDQKEDVETDVPERMKDIHCSLVSASMAIGIGHDQAEEFLALLAVPIMAQQSYRTTELRVEEVLEDDVRSELKENGEREYQMAMEAGNVASDGVAEIDVQGDGSWGMGSYRHNYASKSGCALILARLLQWNKILWLKGSVTVKKPITCDTSTTLVMETPTSYQKLDKRCHMEEELGIKELKENLKNVPYHVFGCHVNCGEKCPRKQLGERDWTAEPEFAAMFSEIVKQTDRLVRLGERLASRVTTNASESANATISRFQGAKRKNHYQRGQYHRRVLAATPDIVMKKVLGRREKRRASRVLRFSKKRAAGEIISRKRTSAPADENYGGDVDDGIEMLDDETNTLKQQHLDALQSEVTKEMRDQIERDTDGQHECKKWEALRLNRMTASKFGEYCKHRPTTSCHNKVRAFILRNSLQGVSAIDYGRVNEHKAIESFMQIFPDKIVRKCGIFISLEHPFLGASPDGLIDDDGLVEVKCLPSVGNAKLMDYARDTKNSDFCLKIAAASQQGLYSLSIARTGTAASATRRWCCAVSREKIPWPSMAVRKHATIILPLLPHAASFFAARDFNASFKCYPATLGHMLPQNEAGIYELKDDGKTSQETKSSIESLYHGTFFVRIVGDKTCENWFQPVGGLLFLGFKTSFIKSTILDPDGRLLASASKLVDMMQKMSTNLISNPSLDLIEKDIKFTQTHDESYTKESSLGDTEETSLSNLSSTSVKTSSAEIRAKTPLTPPFSRPKTLIPRLRNRKVLQPKAHHISCSSRRGGKPHDARQRLAIP